MKNWENPSDFSDSLPKMIEDQDDMFFAEDLLFFCFRLKAYTMLHAKYTIIEKKNEGGSSLDEVFHDFLKAENEGEERQDEVRQLRTKLRELREVAKTKRAEREAAGKDAGGAGASSKKSRRRRRKNKAAAAAPPHHAAGASGHGPAPGRGGGAPAPHHRASGPAPAPVHGGGAAPSRGGGGGGRRGGRGGGGSKP